MKLLPQICRLWFVLIASAAVLAAKPIPGPKGGRILTATAPHVEFFVEPDRTVTVTFYGPDLMALPPALQVVSAVAETKSGKSNLAFEKTPAGFHSRQPLPAGDGYSIVVQVRETSDARPKNYRLLFHEETCDGCKRSEYACICDDAGDGHKHDKKK